MLNNKIAIMPDNNNIEPKNLERKFSLDLAISIPDGRRYRLSISLPMNINLT